MKRTEASITIFRKEGNLISISIAMPIWVNHEQFVSIKIPFLGLETVAKNEHDVDIAVKEAIIGFCIAAEIAGNGLEQELEALGWEKTPGSGLEFNLPDSDVLHLIVHTGIHFTSENLPIAA